MGFQQKQARKDNVLSRRSMLQYLFHQAVLIGVGTVLYPHTTSATNEDFNNNLLNCKNTTPATEFPKSLQ